MRILFSILFLFTVLCNDTFAEPIDHSEKAWNKWSANKPAEENSWLTLAGLYWLKPGISSIGSAASNTHRFPPGMPAEMGHVELNDSGVFFLPNASNVKIKLQADSDSEVLFDHFAFKIIERESTFAIRLQDFKNPAIKKFKGKFYFPWQSDFIINAKFISEDKPKNLQIQTFYGTLRPMPAAGWIEFEINGKTQRLHAVDGGENEPMFVMFKDATSERTTYGAGRYLYVERPDKNGKMVINFNRAYHPPCAITIYATCPLPPKSNHLKIQITAGEKYSADH